MVVGYYTLNSTSVDISDVPEQLTRHLASYPVVPATLLGRLAIDSNYQRRKLGRRLLMDALARSLENSLSHVASAAIVVDALNEDASRFYSSYGFIPFLDSQRLFLPMATVRQLISG